MALGPIDATGVGVRRAVSCPSHPRALHPAPRIGHRPFEVYAAAAGLDDGDLIAQRTGIEGGVDDAVVRRETRELISPTWASRSRASSPTGVAWSFSRNAE